MDPSTEACAVTMAMAAPFLAVASNIDSAAATATAGEKMRRTSSDALHRTVSDVSYELHHNHHQHGTKEKAKEAEDEQLHPVAVVEEAKCECCGMSQECTPEYICGVRRRFSGRWVCGLCAEAVTEEAAGKSGGTLEEALRAHMGMCKRFNGFGRTYPVLCQAEVMREILRRRAKLGPRSRSNINHREVRDVAASGTGIARSSSCMPSITNDEFSDRVSINKN